MLPLCLPPVLLEARLRRQSLLSHSPFHLDLHLIRSACGSGSSSEVPLISGAQAVVSSLWPVSDASTAILISDFYRRYLTQRKQIGYALREAQLWLRSATAVDLLRWTTSRLLNYRTLNPTNWGTVRILLRLRRSLRQSDRNTKPFEAPHHWACFVALVIKSGSSVRL
jgi:hypothetical protein